MKKFRRVTYAALFFALLPLAANAADADAILGTWTTATGMSKVEILKKGDGYSGQVVWLKDPTYPVDPNHKQYVAGRENQPKADLKNPDETLRGRPILGMEVMRGFKPNGESAWSGGTIYDPESGTTYKCKLTLTAPDRLEVRGFVGISLFGRTTVWTK